MSRSYTVVDWYWNVPDQSPGIYKSRTGTYVDNNDPDYQAFLADGGLTTNIASEAELQEVLSLAGVRYLGQTLPATVVDRPFTVNAKCRVTNTGQTISDATPTASIFDSEQTDPQVMHSNSVNPERLVIQENGIYLVTARVRFLESTGGVGANTGTRAAQIRKNIGAGSTDEATTRVGAAPEGNTEFPITEYVNLTAGDTLRLLVEQNCGSPMDIQARISLLRVE